MRGYTWRVRAVITCACVVNTGVHSVRVVVAVAECLTTARIVCILSRPNNTKQEIAHMTKLIEAFRANPTDKARAKLQAYITRHMMAICMASADEIQFLKNNGFKI
jgi:hypothetical protein